MNNKRDDIKLWRDNGLSGGMEILRASCFEHSYPAHFHNEFVIAAFARGAQRHRVCCHAGVAAAGTVMIIHPGEVHTGGALQRDKGWDYIAFYPSETLVEEIAAPLLAQGVSAAQTALDVGFFDQSHFTRHFRIHFGITPGAFGAACR